MRYVLMPRGRCAALSALAKEEGAAAPRVERLPKRPHTTTSETYNRHTYEERRFLPLRRRRGRRGGDASSVAATGGGGITGGRSNNRNASPDAAVKAVDESQKR